MKPILSMSFWVAGLMGLAMTALGQASANRPASTEGLGRSLAGFSAPIYVRDLAGNSVQPLEDNGQKATVFIFIMHECPVANAYAPEIQRLIADYSGKGIRSHVVYVENDLSAEKAREHARDYGYKTGVLLDPKHQLVRLTGATVSPEAVILKPGGEIFYRGRIDDRVADYGKRRVEPTRRDLRLALDALLAGKPVPARLTRAIGCYIPEDHPPKSEKK